jgi:hypothetical protein
MHYPSFFSTVATHGLCASKVIIYTEFEGNVNWVMYCCLADAWQLMVPSASELE